MKTILALFFAFVTATAAADVDIRIGIHNPLAIVKGARCPSKERVSLGEVVTCRPVLIEDDIAGTSGEPVFRTALEVAGVDVLRHGEPPEEADGWLRLSVREGYNGYGESIRVRLEVRNPDGDLLFFNERVTSSRRTLGRTLGHMTQELCVVRKLPPCSPEREDESESD